MGNGSRRARGIRRLAAATSVVLLGAGLAQAGTACREDTVELRGDWGQARFTVEIADDPEEQRIGLMNRETMPASAGMLFVYDTPRRLSFWMRNTLIPLDMIFIDAQGVVQNVHHRAIPLDETSIFGGDDLTTVLEINGGLAERLGIAPGSEVRHPSFAADGAVWPCE